MGTAEACGIKATGEIEREIEAANIVFTTHVEAAVRRHFLAAESRRIGCTGVKADDITTFLNGMEYFQSKTLVIVFTLPPSGPPVKPSE